MILFIQVGVVDDNKRPPICKEKKLNLEQCNQMARLFLQYLAICKVA